MAKKIQMSTIREMANVQVIRIDAALVARVIEAEIKLSNGWNFTVAKAEEGNRQPEYLGTEDGFTVPLHSEELKQLQDNLASACVLLAQLKHALMEDDEDDSKSPTYVSQ